MTYSQPPFDTVAPQPAWDRRRIAVTATVAAVLLAASGVSLVHLAGRYEAAAPLRAQRAAEAEQRRQAREADRAVVFPVPVPVQAEISDESTVGSTGPGAGSGGLSRDALDGVQFETPPSGSGRSLDSMIAALESGSVQGMSRAEARTLAARLRAERGGARPAPTPDRRQDSFTLRWETPPDWPSLRSSDLQGEGTVRVTWTCTADARGRLSRCSGRETPAGSGLAALTRSALERAVVAPGPDGSRAGQVTVSSSFTIHAPYTPPKTTAYDPPRPEPSPKDGPFGSRSDEDAAPILPKMKLDVPAPAER